MRRATANGWKYDGSGSKALAVVSCALAILAAHPIAAQALSDREAGAEMVAIGTLPKAATLVRPLEEVSDDQTRAGVRVKTVRAGVGKRIGEAMASQDGMLLHLQRLGALIVKELAPAFGEGGVSQGPCLAARFDGVGPVVLPGAVGVDSGSKNQRMLVFDSARVYAMTRLLLAPPAVV